MAKLGERQIAVLELMASGNTLVGSFGNRSYFRRPDGSRVYGYEVEGRVIESLTERNLIKYLGPQKGYTYELTESGKIVAEGLEKKKQEQEAALNATKYQCLITTSSQGNAEPLVCEYASFIGQALRWLEQAVGGFTDCKLFGPVNLGKYNWLQVRILKPVNDEGLRDIEFIVTLQRGDGV